MAKEKMNTHMVSPDTLNGIRTLYNGNMRRFCNERLPAMTADQFYVISRYMSEGSAESVEQVEAGFIAALEDSGMTIEELENSKHIHDLLPELAKEILLLRDGLMDRDSFCNKFYPTLKLFSYLLETGLIVLKRGKKATIL